MIVVIWSLYNKIYSISLFSVILTGDIVTVCNYKYINSIVKKRPDMFSLAFTGVTLLLNFVM